MHHADPEHDERAERRVLRALCEQLATDAGRLALQGRRGAELENETKSSSTDIVTQFDRAAEAMIVERIRDRRPDDAIVGEEGAADSGTSGYEWFIDPIDGTTNFVYDHFSWSTSVAVAHEGVMLAGSVAVPTVDELFSAALGEGSTLNGHPIQCSRPEDLLRSLVGTGFSYLPERRVEQIRQLGDVIAHVRDIRRGGSAAIDLCWVACGRLDAYYEAHLNSWDAAAGELIAREAGAITSDFAGGPPVPERMVAASPAVHAELIARLGTS